MEKITQIVENRPKSNGGRKTRAGVYKNIPNTEKCNTDDFRAVLRDVHEKRTKNE